MKTVGEVAKLWGISKRSVYRMIEEGTLQAVVAERQVPIEGYAVADRVVDDVRFLLLSEEECSPQAVRRLLQRLPKKK
jgi:excisionase family DNA binding protein